jgi:hypothetical protein
MHQPAHLVQQIRPQVRPGASSIRVAWRPKWRRAGLLATEAPPVADVDLDQASELLVSQMTSSVPGTL